MEGVGGWLAGVGYWVLGVRVSLRGVWVGLDVEGGSSVVCSGVAVDSLGLAVCVGRESSVEGGAMASNVGPGVYVGSAIAIAVAEGVEMEVGAASAVDVGVEGNGVGVSGEKDVGEAGATVGVDTDVGAGARGVAVGRPLISQPHIPTSKARSKRERDRARFTNL